MFKREVIEAEGLDWKSASEFNGSYEKLLKNQVSIIRVEGNLEKSKLAWKISIYSQAVRYRLIEIMNAFFQEWENDRFVVCFLLARTIIETVAVLYEFEHRLAKALVDKNIDVIDALIMNRTFSSRIADLFGNKKTYEAVNVLTTIDRLDKAIGNLVRPAYDRLSEYAHTNYLGVSSSYSKIDYSYGDVSYGNQNTKHNVFMRLHGEMGLIEMANATFDKIEAHVVTTAALQEAYEKNQKF